MKGGWERGSKVWTYFTKREGKCKERSQMTSDTKTNHGDGGGKEACTKNLELLILERRMVEEKDLKHHNTTNV